MHARHVFLAGLLAVVPFATHHEGRADETPKPWIEAGDIPLPEWARSVEILRDDEALSVSPGGTRRGLVFAGVKLPLLGATRGPGCLSRSA